MSSININKEILRLAWPAIATNITTPLLSLADVAIVGHLNGGYYVGAVAVGGTVFNILYWMFAFLRMGTSGLTAQAFGAADYSQQLRILLRGILIACAGAFIVLILSFTTGRGFISMVDGSGEVQDLAWKYFKVAIWGAPGVLLQFTASGWLLGMQSSRSVMAVALSTNLLNIALSVIFVFVLRMGIVGVGLGTASSQILGAILALIIVYRKCRGLRLPRASLPFILKGGGWRKLFLINRDIFLRTMCLAAVTLWFTHAGSAINANVLAANSLLLQLFLVFSYFMDGFAFSGEALAGRFFGAGDFLTLRRVVGSLFKWGIVTSLIFTVLYFLAADVFITWLTDDSEIIKVAHNYRLWIVTVPLIGFSAFTWDGIMIGLTRTRWLLMSMGAAMIVFFGCYYILTYLAPGIVSPNHALWLSFILYLGVRGIISTILYKREESLKPKKPVWP